MAEGCRSTIVGLAGAGPPRPLEIDGAGSQRREQAVERAKDNCAKERAMAYGHAERNLAAIRLLEVCTEELFGSLAQPDSGESCWLEQRTR